MIDNIDPSVTSGISEEEKLRQEVFRLNAGLAEVMVRTQVLLNRMRQAGASKSQVLVLAQDVANLVQAIREAAGIEDMKEPKQ